MIRALRMSLGRWIHINVKMSLDVSLSDERPMDYDDYVVVDDDDDDDDEEEENDDDGLNDDGGGGVGDGLIDD